MQQHRASRFTHLGRILLAASLAFMLLLPAGAFAAFPGAEGYYPPGYNPANYAANFNPYLVISDDNWRAAYSMSEYEIQAFLQANNSVLKDYYCPEGGPNGLHSQVVKRASTIIAEAAVYWNVSPKLILATLEKEQSLVTQAWHTGRDIDPTSSHGHSTQYHLTYAMGAGVYAGSPDYHPGFGDQVWTGTQKLGQTTGPYAWYPGKVKTVYSYPSAASIDIVPMNQPTWNAYTYTPYFPQNSVWRLYDKFFGDPLAYPGKAPIYRFYNVKNGSHFYTASETERYTVITKYAATYSFEGPAYSIEVAAPAMNQPLYRFYNRRNGSHFYTASLDEANSVVAKYGYIYTFEGAAYNVSMTAEGCVPMYRFYNVRNGSHFYTVSAEERDMVIARWPSVFRFEGVAYFVALSS